MLDSDDKLWIRCVIELAVREIANANPKAEKGDGAIAAQKFREAYREFQRTGMTSGKSDEGKVGV